MTSSSDPCPRSARTILNAGEEGVPDSKGFMHEGVPGQLGAGSIALRRHSLAKSA